MKTPLISFVLALSLAIMPVVTQAYTLGSLTPTLDFPEPAPEPVSQDKTGINK